MKICPKCNIPICSCEKVCPKCGLETTNMPSITQDPIAEKTEFLKTVVEYCYKLLQSPNPNKEEIQRRFLEFAEYAKTVDYSYLNKECLSIVEALQKDDIDIKQLLTQIALNRIPNWLTSIKLII